MKINNLEFQYLISPSEEQEREIMGGYGDTLPTPLPYGTESGSFWGSKPLEGSSTESGSFWGSKPLEGSSTEPGSFWGSKPLG